ncbi:DUF4139 domain-containing protein [Pendulispora albinea]|uniref:DUF4139 domain-containing protein n=2 Tax=Pendulispora albinea TaxID=2741071 RepID=A0ABZ2MCF3_9BACT
MRRAALGAIRPEPKLDVRWRRVDPAARVSDALAALSLADELTLELDRRLASLDEARAELEKRLERARLEAAQAGSAELLGEGRETSAIVVRLGAGAKPDALHVSYAVPAARWWPVYSARFTSPEEGARDAATHALWTLEAFVAQASGEDWRGVRLSLSTAALVRNAQLPELLSYRLGRKQPPPRRGYRPLPEGLSEMFAGYDEALLRSPPPPPPPPPLPHLSSPPSPRTTPAARMARVRANSRLPAPAAAYAAHQAENGDGEGGFSAHFTDDLAKAEPVAFLGAMAEESASAPGGGGASGARPPPPPAPAAREPMPQAMMAPSPMAYGAADGDGGAPLAQDRQRKMLPRPKATRSMARARMPFMASAMEDAPTVVGYPELSEIAPADAWLDFDALVLAPMDDRSARGRLVKEPSPVWRGDDPTHHIEQIPLPRYASDPAEAVGMHAAHGGHGPNGMNAASAANAIDKRGRQVRYGADAPVEIASDALPHRVLVTTGSGPAARTLVVLPRESTDVYREAAARNPFAVALLPGPADVFLDGALLTTSALELTGEGGTVRLGLGVEDRIRVVRNVRVQEESAGFLGGKTAVQHDVAIELSSSLGYPVMVRVYDRVPVTEDKDVEIELLSTRPKPDKYDQAERGAPIRGGLVWEITLGAGARERVDFSYRIVFPGKSELEGGNRRE